MPQSAGGIAAVILLAGVGIGTLLYFLISNSRSQRQSHEHDNRPSTPTSTPLPSTSSPNRNRSQHRPRQTDCCFICRKAMSNSTTRLNCGHIFDDDCYKIWRELTEIGNPSAGHCPRCM